MTDYVLAEGWPEGLVRDIASAIVHRNAELSAHVGDKRVSVELHPARAETDRHGKPRLVPARAMIMIDGKRCLGASEASRAALDLLTALARACGIAESQAGAEPAGPLTIAWPRPSSAHESATMQAIVSMREHREDEMLADFVTKWVRAA